VISTFSPLCSLTLITKSVPPENHTLSRIKPWILSTAWTHTQQPSRFLSVIRILSCVITAAHSPTGKSPAKLHFPPNNVHHLPHKSRTIPPLFSVLKAFQRALPIGIITIYLQHIYSLFIKYSKNNQRSYSPTNGRTDKPTVTYTNFI
jgi:hypothetical protein